MIRALALGFVLLTHAVSAEPLPDQFAALVAEHGIAPASVTVLSPAGDVLVQTAQGQDVSDAAPILSVSKTLTGACVLYLVSQGDLSLETTVADALGWDSAAGNATIAELLTHTSGYRPDRTQRDILGRFLTRPERIAALLERRRTTPLKSPAYFYNNENYIVLEAVLQAVLGQPPMDWCRTNAPGLADMASLATARDYPAIGLAGGYAASTPDLASFMQQLSVTADWPLTLVDDGITYGPGIVLVDTPRGQRLIHRGGMCLLTGRGHGSVVSRDSRGWVVAFTYTGCPSRDAENDLQAMLDAAISP
ncbi:serine hydrolase domain-containing protein [Shimia ponticola]|uniref:serine hydrolase domain-containing protein n=1 Tax=Shimia ponticola TaxID=2582893 RepID=UPI0011BE6DE6|nr:serine hydrolase domain-containing protein [Shimia ponticola]